MILHITHHKIGKTGVVYFTSCIFFLFFTFFSTNVSAQDQVFPKTPSDAEGPFYPVIRQADEDNNLLQISGKYQKAAGDILYLSGQVINPHGQPYKDAVVEIWQTDINGLYKDRRDRSPGKRDPYFQYWGKAKCDAEGSYAFTTLVPGEYHPRPAHIHFKVWINDTVRLTSQIYFNSTNDLGRKQDSRYVTPPLQTAELEKAGKGKYKAWFQIVL